MLLLEGADCTGKTTLANKLARHLDGNWDIWHSGAAKVSYLDDWLRPLVEHQSNDLILDRWHLGDLVYGPTWRGKTMSLHTFWVIEKALQVRGCTLIYTYGDPASTAARLSERGDDLVKPEDIADHMEMYRKVIPMSLLPTIPWSFADGLRGNPPPSNEFMPLHRRADNYRRAFPTMPGIGHLNPEVVYVGEQPNANLLDQSWDVPFAVGPAGEWLFEAISEDEHGGIKYCYLTNAIKGDGNRDLVAQEIRWFDNSPTVVALGLKASMILSAHKIPHVTAPHPSYARRFHHSVPYWETLREALERVPHT